MLQQSHFNYKQGVFTIGNNKNMKQSDIINSIDFIDYTFRHQSEFIAIVDVQTNHIQIAEGALSEVFEEIMPRIKKYSKVKLGVVVNCPVGVAFSFLLEHQLNNDRCSYKTFSTINAAKEWIGDN